MDVTAPVQQAGPKTSQMDWALFLPNTRGIASLRE
jgi:hypothetical protein